MKTAFRVREEPPFTFTGVDFAGPLNVGSPGPRRSGFVFTRAGAIHLDIVPDMSTVTFIRSLKRFTARRGLPRQFVSDNGESFKKAAKMISTARKYNNTCLGLELNGHSMLHTLHGGEECSKE